MLASKFPVSTLSPRLQTKQTCEHFATVAARPVHGAAEAALPLAVPGTVDGSGLADDSEIQIK